MLRRREFLAGVSAATGSIAWFGHVAAQQQELAPEEPQQLDAKLVSQFVGKSHFDLDAVKTMAAEEPMLVHASWDWGKGDWETGLGAAAHTGRRPIAEFLLEQGARIDAFAAGMLGLTPVIRELLLAFPKIHEVPGPHRIPLLSHAIVGGEPANEILQMLLDAGADVNAASRIGMTPLMMAASVGRAEVIETLLARGADAAAKDEKGRTALDWAIEREHDAASELLKKAQ